MAAAAVATNTGGSERDLRTGLVAKQLEASRLKAQVQQVRFEAQQIRLRLQAAGVNDPTLVPSKINAGSGSSEPQRYELRSLFQWLVETVDLSHQVIFECGSGEGEVQVGGRRVLLQRMATWKLSMQSDSNLKLSVPLDLQAEIAEMLTGARRRGRLDESQLQNLASSWELVGAEVMAASVGTPEPAIFLVHKQTAQAVVIAQWPSVEFVRAVASPPSFDPASHFQRLAMQPQQAHVVRPTQPVPPPSPVPDAPRPPLATATQALPKVGAAVPGWPVATGDRVEVEFEGQWFAGVLQWVDGDVANVKCDVDSPGIITVAPLNNVRPARGTATAQRPRAGTFPMGVVEVPSDKKLFRHMRARSVG
eukprot:gb/GFBE01005621.1/.p1 GENE.gb/GFBE01005621.1/~~gb/GFBE01005621.1/.p1  ORF type:complete len:364 (+),score=63.74 gb/GFBE01005621.1/:1-1092(+)